MIESHKIVLLLLAWTTFKSVHGGIGCGGAITCTTNPCNSTTCPQQQQATCRMSLDECGRCVAIFSVGGRDLTRDECIRETDVGSGPIAPCPDGSPPVTCAANPCDSASCEGEPTAECRVNRCGSCKAEFYIWQTKVSNRKCAGIGPCPPDIPQAGCLNPPGQICLGQSCRMFPNAECIIDGCGGCTVIFIMNGRRLTKEECDGCPRRSCRPCESAVCPSHPTARCEEERCGKCKATFYGPSHRKIERCCNAETCPDGSSRYRCSKNPCDGASCLAVPGAACKPDYCGGCKKKFVLRNGIEISEAECRPIEFCPPNVPIAKCRGDMCETNPCTRYPGASCKIDGCNGCKTVYFYQGRRLTNEECNGCPKNDRVMSCGNPCLGASCGSARCEPQVCGQCKARFFGLDRTEITNCGTTQGCSGGLRRIQCRDDPCVMSSCPGVSNAECRPNYCGGCHAEYYYPGTNRRIPDYICVEKEICPGDLPVAGCAASPGLSCLGETCPNYPEARCHIDSCNGCTVTFYEGRRRLTREDCHGCPSGIEKKQCEDPCKDAVCALYPTARCEPRVCGKCGVAFFGLDRREIADCCAEAPPLTTTTSAPTTPTTIATTSTTAATTTTTNAATTTTTSTSAPSCFDSIFSPLCDSDPCLGALCRKRTDATCRSNYCTCKAEFFSGQVKLTTEQCDDGCPADQPRSDCKKNPCDGARCPTELRAECRPNYCGGCKPEFYIFGRMMSYRECGLCANGKEAINCGIVPPCFEKTCRAFPNAKCRSTNCGECREWFEDNNGNVVDCDATTCPADNPRQNCERNPCDGATCPNVPTASCRPNYCGGCKAEFFEGQRRLTDYDCIEKPDRCAAFTTCLAGDGSCRCGNLQNVRCVMQFCAPNSCKTAYFDANGMRIPDEQCVSPTPSGCPPDKPPVQCRIDPCESATCPGNSKAVCRLNFCGGCFAEFILNGRKLSDIECVERLDRCAAFTTCPNNICKCKGVPNSQCIIQFCPPNRCKPLYFDASGKRLSNTDCEQRQCDAPEGIPNGRVNPAGRKLKIGEFVTYTCNVGYRRRGNDRRTCVQRRGRVVLFESKPQCFDTRCPSSVGSIGICATECSTNADCGFNRICCWNGCAATCVQRQGLCPGGEVYTQCFSDPCQFASCPRYPNAKCVANYCGGCFQDWYQGSTKLPIGSCFGSDPRCPLPANLPRLCLSTCTTSADCKFFEACCLNSCGHKNCVGYA